MWSSMWSFGLFDLKAFLFQFVGNNGIGDGTVKGVLLADFAPNNDFDGIEHLLDFSESSSASLLLQ